MTNRQRISAKFNLKHKPIVFDYLSFEDKVFVGTIAGSLGNDELNRIKPYHGSAVKIAPTSDLTHEIYMSLYNSNIIVVDSNSPIDSFVFCDGQPFARYFHIFYKLNTISKSGNTMKRELLSPSFFIEGTEEAALLMWRKIAISECTEYLLYQLTKVKLLSFLGNKTNSLFDDLLNDFSVSQIYAIIWKAVRDTCRQCLEHNYSREQATNYALYRCWKYSQDIKSNGWNCSTYNRLFDLPQSELSMYFFDFVLKIGDVGFRERPNIQLLKELLKKGD